MRTLHTTRIYASARARAASLLTLIAVFATVTLVAACGSGGSGSSSSGDSAKAPLSVVAPVVDCSKLAAIDITDIGGAGSSITSATVTTATINGASVNFCTVKGTLAPSNTFEVALPVSSWTQRFAELGCGGLCGNVSDPTQQSSFSFSYTCPLVQEGGFVTAATDMGHSGNDSTWTTDPQKQADFAYRGQHITTLTAEKLIKAYYGQAQKYAYFVGCSDGGREALMAAQRYPNDYNGIIAGAPAAHFQIQNSLYHGWSVKSQSTTGRGGRMWRPGWRARWSAGRPAHLQFRSRFDPVRTERDEHQQLPDRGRGRHRQQDLWRPGGCDDG